MTLLVQATTFERLSEDSIYDASSAIWHGLKEAKKLAEEIESFTGNKLTNDQIISLVTSYTEAEIKAQDTSIRALNGTNLTIALSDLSSAIASIEFCKE